MKQLTNKKYMTVKEIAEILNCSVDTIQYAIKKYYPNKMQKGKITYLNEQEVTVIKLELDKTANFRNVSEVSTDLEMLLLSKKVDKWKDEKIRYLQTENEIMKPKAESYDKFLNSSGLHSMSEVAKMFGTGRTRLFKLLRDNNYLRNNNQPYQQYIDNGYFEIKQFVINTGESKPVTKVTSKGIVFIEKILKKVS